MGKGKVLVLGGAGFLGSHVADALSDTGYAVRIFDLHSSPYLRGGQEMVVGDLLQLDQVIAAAEGCHVIYNFAGLADIDDAKDRPVSTVQLNVLGTVHGLEAARVVRAERFVFASSVYVYSEHGSFYRASKQSAERFVEAYHDRYGLDYTILRYGSLYGRRADERNGIYRFLKQALMERIISFKGSPDAEREYIHVKDAAGLSVQILDEAYRNRHLILTGQERMPVKNLMKMIAEMLPYEVRVEYVGGTQHGHYEMTPYAFNPRVGHKLVMNDFVDIGQGLLDCLAEMHHGLHCEEYCQVVGDWLVTENSGRNS